MITIFAPRKAGLTLVLFLGASVLSAGHRGVNVSIDEGREPARCEDIAISIDGTPAARAQERLRIAEKPAGPLRIRVPNHSGMRVVGSDRGDFEVQVCKAAGSEADLTRISVTQSADEVSVRGPAGERWVAYLLISAPRGAAMSLEAENAPIGLRGLSGRVTARSINGPISIQNCTGEIDAEAENGPIHLSGGAGRLRLKTDNGPIGVSLSGSTWSGEGLEARAVNGPLHLVIPAGYRSGAVVESRGYSPFHCRGEACSGARRSWDDAHRRLEIGEGPALLHLSTENGPVSVSAGGRGGDAEDEDADGD
jgi:hypothetical protein